MCVQLRPEIINLFFFLKLTDDYTVILRFLGTTPSSSNIMNCYKSILYQIESILDNEQNEKVFTDQKELKIALIDKIVLFSKKYPQKRLLIFMDSVDQLANNDYTDLEWMITEFPANVKIIFTILESFNNVLENTKRLIRTADNYLHVNELTRSNVKPMLEGWLNQSNRSLDAYQWTILNNILEKAKLYPLFIDLIFKIASKWRSFDKPDDEFNKISTIEDCINYLFKLLEIEHGKVLFSRCVFYIISMKNGISESELEDILSIDDSLLENLFEYHSPPIRRFPLALWTKIKYKLDEFIVEKEADDITVISLYHRQFIDVLNARYVTAETKDENLKNAIDYFIETWKDKLKPFKHNPYYAKKKNIPLDSTAYRFINPQPIEFISEKGEKRFNKRKLSELPHLISELEHDKAVINICEHFAFNYDFFYAKLMTTDVVTILKELQIDDVKSEIEDIKRLERQIGLFSFILISNFSMLQKNPQNFAIQLCAKGLIFYRILNCFKNLIDEADLKSPNSCALITPYQYLLPPGDGLLISIENHKAPIKTTLINERLIITCSDRLNAFEMSELKNFGEIVYPDNILVEETRAYFNHKPEMVTSFNLIDGGYVLRSQDTVMSYKFDQTLIFSKKFSNLKNIFLVPKKFLVLQFEDETYFEIYNVLTGEKLIRESFKTKIKLMACNVRFDRIIEMNLKNDQEFSLVVVLEKSEIHRFKIGNEKSILTFVFKLPPAGIECHALSFSSQEDSMCFDDPNYFVLAFEDGGFCCFMDEDYESDESVDAIYFKPNPIIKNKIDLLKIQAVNESGLLFITSNGDVYVMNRSDSMIRMIPGQYQITSTVTSNYLALSSYGSVDCFYLPKTTNNDKSHKALKYLKFDAHYDDLTYLENTGIPFVLIIYFIFLFFFCCLNRICYYHCFKRRLNEILSCLSSSAKCRLNAAIQCLVV